MGIMDISMNNCGILTEIVAGKPLLGSFHGTYSVAAALGSLLGGLFISAHIETMTAFLMVFGVAFFFSFITCWHMYDPIQEKFLTDYHGEDRKDITKPLMSEDYQEIEDDRATMIRSYDNVNVHVLDQNRGTVITYGAAAQTETGRTHEERLTMSEFVSADQLFDHKQSLREISNEDTHEETSVEHNSTAKEDSGFSFEGLYAARKIIFFFSLVGFLGAFGESGIMTWSVVYFDRYIPAESMVKSLGLTSFMVCMGAGRFLCDYLRHRFGRRWIFRIGGLLALSGLVLVVLCVDLPAAAVFACLGFGLTGLGLSTIIPIVFSSVGHLPGVHAGTALATAAFCSYSGSIVSSPIIGLLSDLFGSLRMALLVDALLLGMIFPLSWGIIPETAVFQKQSEKEENADQIRDTEPLLA
jgi:MFS family permease